MQCGFRLHQELFYEKTGPPPDPTRYEETIEKMFVFSRGKPKTINLIMDKRNRWGGTKQFGARKVREKDGTLTTKDALVIREFGKRTVVWRYAVGFGYSTDYKEAFQHPAIFPEKLAYDHIVSWSNKGDVILDPFAGSGTTLVACIQSDRNGIGIEVHPPYFEIAKKRIEQAQLQVRMPI